MRSGRFRILLRSLFIVVVVALAAANFLRPARSKTAGASRAPRSVPLPVARPNAFGLIPTTAAEVLVRIRHSKAKGVLVNAWASWCGPCKQEVPLLLEVKSTIPEIDVMLVSVDEEASHAEAATLLEGFGARGPSFVVEGPLGEFKAIMNPKWKGMIPATFLYDTTPKLRYFWGGPVFQNELMPLLKRYLAGEHIDGEANFALSAGRVEQ